MKKGFTLLEVVVSIAGLAMILSAGWFSFSSYAVRRELESGAARVSALITEARSKTLAGENNSAYGVHFEQDRAVLFRAPTYVSGSAENKMEILARRTLISSIDFTDSEVVFKRLTGGSVSSGSVTISVRGNPSLLKVITVELLGTVEW
ncbi:MAG: hypothetical protein A3C08_02425 [Candidatus Taylorbacteria bacterium RIFCSPHIGHO2_02_FULL_47_18]|uniref:General secretion pathway GspH domain-containing protein n=1 Tax=Candidatus Taylorbacteria bacterium RIFCSPLOWO2_01_FULL_48_100 TaxID=1802322 RepID=A0A1G2NFZ3_9BACT|nr:MAG: hypothetical protein A3C08_02425 [Candidatus Taylorbacteria bacterium RIFCSPHIGHO2_02_FULL_47_18]OHA35008.1 MAG: hypothetical protein A2938_01410 [Candidatus Taylorbacteria bacterium RIFCSPLOWO2_01_FULL_48_100]OHA40957.1 MAG: hypothetical protein A3J31_00105 [Candidatus Taylorbacteria bacterium RIFCSPLOWO2_02_FULL_48_16]OHA44706.1 MAG: hypothetical protein A3H13_03155 [Candidatus Taylorbacteria bacterium RIFCSPLOWO2_12_FULL_48_11]